MTDVNGKTTEFERLREIMETVGVNGLTNPEWATYRLMLKEPHYQLMPAEEFGPATPERVWWQVR